MTEDELDRLRPGDLVEVLDDDDCDPFRGDASSALAVVVYINGDSVDVQLAGGDVVPIDFEALAIPSQ